MPRGAIEQLVLLIGPSGIGTSTALGLVAMRCGWVNSCRFPDFEEKYRKHSLDIANLWFNGAPRLVRRGVTRVLDVDARYLDPNGKPESEIVDWLRQHFVIAFTASSELAYERKKQRGDTRTLVEYRRAEFNPHRCHLYATADVQISAAGEPQEVATLLEEQLNLYRFG